MGFLKFVFVILLIVPVVIVMIILFRKLTAEYNNSVRKEHDIRSEKYRKDKEAERYSQMKDYRRDNPAYDAYRRRMEENNFRK